VRSLLCSTGADTYPADLKLVRRGEEMPLKNLGFDCQLVIALPTTKPVV
jgi:hypothetical protein